MRKMLQGSVQWLRTVIGSSVTLLMYGLDKAGVACLKIVCIYQKINK